MGWNGSVHLPGTAGSQREQQSVGISHFAWALRWKWLNISYSSSDLWALGCILYQMVAGRFAFHGLSEYLTWQKIKQLDYSFPDGFDEQAKDLVERLLVSATDVVP